MAQRKANAGLTHIDAGRRPTMVDVSDKIASAREAVAEASVRLPPAVSRALQATGHRSKKGPIFDTAIIAGVQAVKRTHDLIPFCHPLPVEAVDFKIATGARGRITVRCHVAVHHKTGVEMEALTGASIAALTIYDMCKALSHDIVIESIRLLEKRGGKRAFKRKRA